MLGTRITERMSELGIKTQSELAARTGLSVSYVGDLIRGTRGKRLGHTTTIRLARALKVKPIFFSSDYAVAEKGNDGHAIAKSQVGNALHE